MVDDTSLLDSDSVIPIISTLRLETPIISDLAQPIIESDSQPYKGN